MQVYLCLTKYAASNAYFFKVPIILLLLINPLKTWPSQHIIIIVKKKKIFCLTKMNCKYNSHNKKKMQNNNGTSSSSHLHNNN